MLLRLSHAWSWSLVIAGTLLVGGCSEAPKKIDAKQSSSGKSAEGKTADKSAETKSSEPAKPEEKMPEPAAAKDEPAPEEKKPEERPAESKPAEAAKEGEAPNVVVLGSPELTAGVPGDGKLTLDQAKAWFDDAKNSEVLNVQLPLGLAAGQDQIKGLDANPMTRAKIELGRQLYFDPRLSVDATISCASCHHPDTGYAANSQFGIGVRGQQGGRNSPVSYNRILSDKQFWDGRAGSLEEQAKGPIANPIEMANTHEVAVKTVNDNPVYKHEFEKVFGGPATIDNIAQAIATFERAIVTAPSPFDYNERLRAYANIDLEDLKTDDPEGYAEYEKVKAEADAHPMSEAAKRGREIFFTDKGSCTACHVGPNLADEQYHNLGVGMEAEKPDLGRYEITKEDKDKGAFKTPTIRNVELTAPYMHDGSQKTLEEVVEWYAKGGHPNPHLDAKIKKLELTDQDKADLVAFMKACTGAFPQVRKDRLPE